MSKLTIKPTLICKKTKVKHVIREKFSYRLIVSLFYVTLQKCIIDSLLNVT